MAVQHHVTTIHCSVKNDIRNLSLRMFQLKMVAHNNYSFYNYTIMERSKPMTFGEKLQKLRKEHKLSQEELALQINISRQAISKWELNESKPDTDNIIQLSNILGVSIDYLLNDTLESLPVKPAIIEEKNETVHKKNTGIGSLIILICIIIALIFFMLNATGSLFIIVEFIVIVSLIIYLIRHF